MKKKWQAPELEILSFDIQDVISETSPEVEPNRGDHGLPYV